MSHHILIVDDEAAIRDMVRLSLEIEGFDVSDAANAHQAALVLQREQIDLILLDWMMPGVAGIDFAARLKRENKYPDTGIIMLTAKDQERDLVRGFAEGVDDYVRKPFSTKELISRIHAVLRRVSGDREGSQELLTAEEISLDLVQHRVTINDNIVEFSPTEFRLLKFFLTNQNRVFNRDHLLDHVWGDQSFVEDRTVDVHIRRLRKILEPFDCAKYIQTVRGVGYRFSTNRR